VNDDGTIFLQQQSAANNDSSTTTANLELLRGSSSTTSFPNGTVVTTNMIPGGVSKTVLCVTIFHAIKSKGPSLQPSSILELGSCNHFGGGSNRNRSPIINIQSFNELTTSDMEEKEGNIQLLMVDDCEQIASITLNQQQQSNNNEVYKFQFVPTKAQFYSLSGILSSTTDFVASQADQCYIGGYALTTFTSSSQILFGSLSLSPYMMHANFVQAI